MHNLQSYKDALYWAGKAHSKKRGKPMGNYCSLVLQDDMTIALVDTGYRWEGMKPRHVHARIYPNDDVQLFCYGTKPDGRVKNVHERALGVDIQRIGKGKYVVWDNRGMRVSDRWNFPTQWLEYGKKMPLFENGMRYNLRTKQVIDGHHERKVEDTDKAAEWKQLVVKAHRVWRVMAKVGAIQQQAQELLALGEKRLAETYLELRITPEEVVAIIREGLTAEHVKKLLATADGHGYGWHFQRFLESGCKANAPFLRVFENVYRRHNEAIRKLAGCYEVERVSTNNEPERLAA